MDNNTSRPPARRPNDSLARHLSQALLKANLSRHARERGDDPLADVLLGDAMQEGASDIHLDPPRSDGLRARSQCGGFGTAPRCVIH